MAKKRKNKGFGNKHYGDLFMVYNATHKLIDEYEKASHYSRSERIKAFRTLRRKLEEILPEIEEIESLYPEKIVEDVEVFERFNEIKNIYRKVVMYLDKRTKAYITESNRANTTRRNRTTTKRNTKSRAGSRSSYSPYSYVYGYYSDPLSYGRRSIDSLIADFIYRTSRTFEKIKDNAFIDNIREAGRWLYRNLHITIPSAILGLVMLFYTGYRIYTIMDIRRTLSKYDYLMSKLEEKVYEDKFNANVHIKGDTLRVMFKDGVEKLYIIDEAKKEESPQKRTLRSRKKVRTSSWRRSKYRRSKHSSKKPHYNEKNPNINHHVESGQQDTISESKAIGIGETLDIHPAEYYLKEETKRLEEDPRVKEFRVVITRAGVREK